MNKIEKCLYDIVKDIEEDVEPTLTDWKERHKICNESCQVLCELINCYYDNMTQVENLVDNVEELMTFIESKMRRCSSVPYVVLREKTTLSSKLIDLICDYL